MRRIKVVSEASDLVPILHAFDSDVKRDVFAKLTVDWQTTKQIEAEYGEEGVAALRMFEKTRLVETRWQPVEGAPEKAYRSYYTTFQFNFSSPVQDIGEILTVAAMEEEAFQKEEEELLALVGPEGFSARTVTEKLNMPLVRLRALLKRSNRLDLKGHMVIRLK